MISVDVASVDRRNKEKEEESLKRVGSLVEAFKNSNLHMNTVKEITANRHRLPTRGDEKKESGPGIIRVFITILRCAFISHMENLEIQSSK